MLGAVAYSGLLSRFNPERKASPCSKLRHLLSDALLIEGHWHCLRFVSLGLRRLLEGRAHLPQWWHVDAVA